MKHRCPVCRKVIDGALQKQSRREKFYPFCCNRCKLIDLGQWLDGKYKIVAELKPEDSQQVEIEDAASPSATPRQAEDVEAKTVDNPKRTADNNCVFR